MSPSAHSIRPDRVTDVYREFGPQENFRARLIDQDIRSVVRKADANATLAASLTDPILRQRYLDTLKELAKAGNLVVVAADGGNQIINIPAK